MNAPLNKEKGLIITNEIEGQRDKAILELFYATGLRLSELVSINICDIDKAEIYVNDIGTGAAGWAPVAGGGPSIGEDSVIRCNPSTIAENLTIGPVANNDAKYTNGFTCGPIEIQSGYTVTIESNAAWSVI